MISVVIPIFNEEENINKLSQSITKALSDIDYEVLFINDGSTDNSENEIVKLSSTDPKIKLINLRRNYGQTGAMQAGFVNQKVLLLYLWMVTYKMTLRIFQN